MSNSKVNQIDDYREKSMYYSLVNKDFGEKNDLVGMIAYALYKADKINYIEDHKSTANGEKPNHDKLLAYQLSKVNPKSKDYYRSEADELLLDMVNYILEPKNKQLDDLININKKDKEKNQILSNKLKAQEKEQNQKEKYCKAVKPFGFFSGVFQSVIGSFVFLLLTVFAALALKINIIEIIKSVL